MAHISTFQKVLLGWILLSVLTTLILANKQTVKKVFYSFQSYSRAPIVTDCGPVAPSSTIHFAVTCCGADYVDYLRIVLQSIKASQTSPYVVHVLTDQNLESFPDLPLDSVDPIKIASVGSWRVCRSMRLLKYAQVLDVPKVIHLDLDVIVVGDMKPFWDTCDDHFVFAHSDSPWYLTHATPHLGNGFNSGVLLMPLHKEELAGIVNLNSQMIANHYNHLYTNSGMVGDQDLLNYFCYLHPHRCMFTDCKYNVDPRTNIHRCRSVTVVHNAGRNFGDKWAIMEALAHPNITERFQRMFAIWRKRS